MILELQGATALIIIELCLLSEKSVVCGLFLHTEGGYRPNAQRTYCECPPSCSAGMQRLSTCPVSVNQFLFSSFF